MTIDFRGQKVKVMGYKFFKENGFLVNQGYALLIQGSKVMGYL